MRWWRIGIFFVVALLIAAMGVLARGARSAPDKAEAFLNGLTAAQRAEAMLPFEGEARTTWNYVPMKRAGVPLKELNADSKTAALELLRSCLSEAGFQKAEAIRTKLEVALRDAEHNPSRVPEMYYVAFFGKPSAKGSWGWRWEGHHVSFNFTYHDGQIVSSTPQFLGSNPAEVREGPNKGLRVLDKEEDLARELVMSLTESQQKEAILATQAPSDLTTTNQRKVGILEDKGLSYSVLTVPQKKLLRELIETYALVQNSDQSKARLAKIEKGGWDKLKFAWMGGLEKGQGHYYRIQGPSFLIEYDNTQNNANHVHSVWRDFEGDFGRDVLAEHYAEAHHHH